MEKTSIYLTGRERERLAELSEATGMSQSEIVREAIAHYDPRPPVEAPRSFAVARSGSGPGGSIADVPDAELLEGFGE